LHYTETLYSGTGKKDKIDCSVPTAFDSYRFASYCAFWHYIPAADGKELKPTIDEMCVEFFNGLPE